MPDPLDADLWVLRPAIFDGETEEALLDRFGPLLSDDERVRQKRSPLERIRRQYLLTRALARTALSQYCRIEPAEWRFAAGPKGRPHIEAPQPGVPLDFNLSHAEGMIVCLVGPIRMIGVDVEFSRRVTELAEVARRFFSPAEVSGLLALPESERRDRFFALWTLKEAYIKARGLGLALPLDAFSYSFDADGGASIAFDRRIDDDPAAWRFARFALSDDHPCAVALRVGAAGSCSITIRETSLPPR